MFISAPYSMDEAQAAVITFLSYGSAHEPAQKLPVPF